ncbi:CarboxypepD_reg-like domain-containing protein [Flavobacterium haoranii]|uniref:CarboxypepD_reg-like domain-containing protein n=1 Tax=Flavobacterium haoranii TaxID=683124 RepID=A0A1M6FZY9_9FLAO|nr:CarboxypepD_reg-like domain-containing protein [Flavobacterium haoranii]
MFFTSLTVAQTKVGGKVIDEFDEPVAFANVFFKNSKTGVITDENGNFYFESDENYSTLVVSFVGFETQEIPLKKGLNSNLKIVLKEGTTLKEVIVYTGKTSKKNNPAIDILRKIWARKKKNGLYMFDQYKYDKYEKVEFDMNTIDSAFMNSKVFKGMEFIFDNIDTSRITGKTYLPIFINESLLEVYGDNLKKKKKEILKANKNSGFGNGDGVNTFIKDLYADYNIYNNYLKFFDKSFVSPLSRTGIDVYNYVLSDSAYIDNKWCYNIVYYPRRKNELTFKGDFWVNDSTWAIKKINLEASKSANINWVKEIYIEQEFDVLNDSVFLLKRDYMMSDFSLSKKEESKGVYGKRTTVVKNHVFNEPKDDKFYREEVNFYDNEVFAKTDEFWNENRFEGLNENESGIYKMLDTLQTVPKFKKIYNLATILGSGYIQVGKFDYGPIFSTFGYNDVEGLRVRAGGRTYFGPNDKWRLQGYAAYGFKDNKVKYGLLGKWMVDTKNRIILSLGNRRDVEQIGVSLTTSNDVLGRSFASSSLFSSGTNNKLTSINLTTLGFEMEPVKNFIFQTNFSYRTLKSASNEFSLDYYTDLTQTEIKSEVKQAEINLVAEYTPKRKTVGYGVDRLEVDNNYARLFLSYSNGMKGVFDSDFNYQKVQFYYRQPVLIGGFGRLFTTFEAGKIFGEVPLGLMGVIPGNQSYFSIENTYNLLDYYDFVADQYASLHFEHNFGGRLFSRVPYLRKLNLREIIGVKGVVGSVSDENIMINASGLNYVSPENLYWEYHAGVGNIFKVLRIDFAWRGSYLDMPNARKFAVRASFGFYF